MNCVQYFCQAAGNAIGQWSQLSAASVLCFWLVADMKEDSCMLRNVQFSKDLINCKSDSCMFCDHRTS
jgi:hypothetical protein